MTGTLRRPALGIIIARNWIDDNVSDKFGVGSHTASGSVATGKKGDMDMRSLLLSLLVGSTLSVSGHAQTAPREMMPGAIGFIYTGEIQPGQLENFKQFAAKVVESVAKEEPGTLVYQWSLRPDQKTYDVIEVYESSDAVAAHLKHVLPKFGEDLGRVQKEVSCMVLSAPNDAAKDTLALLKATYETPVAGFVR